MKNKLYIILLVLITIFLLIKIFTNNNFTNIKNENFSLENPRNIWVYWENINRDSYPTFIKLCLDSMKKHLGKYNLYILDNKSIKKYLPELRNDFDNLKVAQKVDYYRIALLHKYGGIWLDADIIVMSDLKSIFEKLDSGHDYVGFGCTGGQCTYGYLRPSNWVIGAQKNSVLMKRVLDKLNSKLDSRDKNLDLKEDTYHDYGKLVIWEALDELKQTGYDYYHFSSEHDGTRDKDGYWIHTPEFFSTQPLNFLDESKIMFVVLYNSEILPNESIQWVKDCKEEELLNSDLNISKLYKKALGI